MSEPSTRPGTPSSANEENAVGPFGQPTADVTKPVDEKTSITTTGSFRVVVYPGTSDYAQVQINPKAIEAFENRQQIRRLLDED